jgi:cytochrome c peroxidase
MRESLRSELLESVGSMKRFIILALVLGGMAAISLPLVNLIVEPPETKIQEQLTAIQDPYFKKAAPILQSNCAHCHATGTARPFYASFPLAGRLIEQDILQGLTRFDFSGKLIGAGEGFSPIELARLEHVLQAGTMPPVRYVALHWRANLDNNEKETLLAWIRHSRQMARDHQGSAPNLDGEPLAPIPFQVALNQDKVALGNRLFHDTRLSGDNTLSCASCHALNKGGTDQSRVSTGIAGQKGGINAPTVYNAGFNFVQFWDGRAPNLKEQARGPVANPIEMGAAWPDVVAKLNQDPVYVKAFQSQYPNGLNEDNIVDAIAEFERSLTTPNSRFDRYLQGNRDVLSQDEQAGYQLFKANCASCHAGVNLGGLSYEKMGRHRPYFTNPSAIQREDLGRFNVTHREADKHYFKVPTLRNVAVTWPYFHNGSTSDLREAVRVMARHQVDADLSEREIDQLTAFLKTLTGEFQGKPLQ